MKGIQSTIGSSQPILSEADFSTIFFKIPELHRLHSNFLEELKKHAVKWDTRIGDSFKHMVFCYTFFFRSQVMFCGFKANNLVLYGAFLSNYGLALDTVRKCSSNSPQFYQIARNIICKNLSEQPITLEDLLHKPVAR